MSCPVRDDARFYVRYVAFPILLVIYSVALGHCLFKLSQALKSRNRLGICIFSLNCLFFSSRCVYWLDIAFNYPIQVFMFLDEWPHIIQSTATMTLGVSWLIICYDFHSSFSGGYTWVIRAAVSVGVVSHVGFIALFVGLIEAQGCRSAEFSARVCVIAIMPLVGAFTGFYGLKLVRLINSNLTGSSTTKIKLMLVLAGICTAVRVFIDLFSLLDEADNNALSSFEEGAVYVVFLVVDYCFSEVLFMYGITHTLTAAPIDYTFGDISMNLAEPVLDES
jgi:hypothetical protein